MSTYYLGYDQSCSVCARTGERIGAEVGGELAVVPLQSARMAQLREQALGEGAPWAPTLVRVDGDRVEAWTGLRMGPALTRVVGVARASRILSIVGEEQVRSGRTGPHLRRIGRRPFLRTAVCAAAGALTLAGVGTPAFASGTPERGARRAGELRHDAAVGAGALALLDGPDGRVAFVGSSVSRDVRASTGDRYRVQSFGVDEQAGRHTAVGVHDTRDGLIYRAHETRAASGEVVESGAEVYEVRSGGTALRVRSRSMNGSAPEPLPASRVVRASAVEADPCGGCTGPGGPGDQSKKSVTECVSDIDVECALALTGCAACPPTCGASAGAACAFCLVTSCGSLLAGNGCCKGDGSTRQVCRPCTTAQG